MNTLTKTDLEDLTLLLEDFVKRLPKMERKERIDLAARLKPAAKHLEAIDKAVKEEIKERLKGKEGTVLGEDIPRRAETGAHQAPGSKGLQGG